MNKVLFLLLFNLVTFNVFAQTVQVSVALKSGVVIKGELIELNPTEFVNIKVAGKETKITMDKVASIETSNQPRQNNLRDQVGEQGNSDSFFYPDKYELKIDGQIIDMLLIPGGKFNMGFDGDGSMKMDSEPVHEVAVTSYYISTQPLPVSIVKSIVNNKYIYGFDNQPAQVKVYDDVDKIIYNVSQKTGLPLRLPTEAEWEYAAVGNKQNEIFSIASGRTIAYEWCSDFHGKFPESRVLLTDPVGPISGKEHVVRAYNGKRGKFDRSNDVDERNAYLGLIRLAIKAKDIKY